MTARSRWSIRRASPITRVPRRRANTDCCVSGVNPPSKSDRCQQSESPRIEWSILRASPTIAKQSRWSTPPSKSDHPRPTSRLPSSRQLTLRASLIPSGASGRSRVSVVNPPSKSDHSGVNGHDVAAALPLYFLRQADFEVAFSFAGRLNAGRTRQGDQRASRRQVLCVLRAFASAATCRARVAREVSLVARHCGRPRQRPATLVTFLFALAVRYRVAGRCRGLLHGRLHWRVFRARRSRCR